MKLEHLSWNLPAYNDIDTGETRGDFLRAS